MVDRGEAVRGRRRVWQSVSTSRSVATTRGRAGQGWGDDLNPGSQIPGSQISGSQISGSQISGSQIPGSQIRGSQTPGSQIPGNRAIDRCSEYGVSVVLWSRKHRPPGGGRLPRRCTDRVEDGAAWMLMAVGLFVLALSVLAGVRTGAETAERGRAAVEERAQVEAVVLNVAAVPDGEPDADSMDVATVRYTDRAGRIREDVLWMTVQPSAGTTVQVWVDRAGALAPAPLGDLDPVVIGALVGLGAAGTGALLLISTWLAVRGFLDQRNAAAWAREWKKVEPEWTGRRL
jgi:hypothetical protein